MRRSRALLTAMASALALCAIAATLLVAREDWNWARPAAEWAIGRFSGRPLELAGDLRVDLGRRSHVEARDVRFANAEWARVQPMLAADRVAFTLRLAPLLRGKLDLERLELDGARVELEKDGAGRDNWTLVESDEPLPLPRELRLRDTDLRLLDPRRPDGFALHVAALELRAIGGELAARGSGVYQRRQFTLAARLANDPGAGEPVPFVAHATVGATEARAEGVFSAPDGALDARLQMTGQSLDDLWRLIGLPLPQSPPYALATRLSWRGDEVELAELRARIGSSDLAGRLGVSMPAGRRMFLDADLRARTLALDDVEGFYGRPPHRETARGGSAPPPGSRASIFPATPFSFPKLRVADATIRFAADRIRGETVLDDVRVRATLRDGKLRLDPLELGMAAGELTVRGLLDASADETALRASIALSGVDLSRLLAPAELEDEASGTLSGRVELVSRGNSLHAIARHADGRVGVALRDGSLSRELLELTSLHLGGYLGQKLDKDREPEPIDCLVGVFHADDGVLASRTLLLDTDHVRIEGRGTIDLGREAVGLELRQHAKRPTFGALQTPIIVEGPLLASTARLEKKPLARRAAVAAALGAVLTPWAALLPLVDAGDGDRPEACAEALAQFRPIGGDLPTPRRGAG